MKPSLPASCWPALTRDLARTGAAGVPSGASTTASYSQLDGRSTARVIEPSVPRVYVHGSGAWATGTDVTALPEYGVAVRGGGHLAILRNGWPGRRRA